MNSYFETKIQHTNEDGKRETSTYMIQASNLEEALSMSLHQIVVSMDTPAFKMIKQTGVTDYHELDECEATFKVCVAYITEHPVKEGKIKTTIEYCMVDANNAQHAYARISDILSEAGWAIGSTCRVDSVKRMTVTDIMPLPVSE